MKHSKPAFAQPGSAAALEREQEDRQLALEYLAAAWNEAEGDGVEGQALAHASLFAALATFVQVHGEEATAELISTLPDKIRAGEYNVMRSLQ